MSGKGQSDGVAMEILAFMINALKQHENEIDRLIGGLGTVKGDQSNNNEKLNDKVEKIGEKITDLQNKIDKLKSYVSLVATAASTAEQKDSIVPEKMQSGSTSIMKCKQWGDFQNLAVQADALAFVYKEKEKTCGVEALKGDKLMAYNGEVPTLATLLKVWLSKQLEIFDGESVFVASNQRNANGAIAKSDVAGSQEIVVITCDADLKGLNKEAE
jgi:hypothetical protein